jgi:serine protease Do
VDYQGQANLIRAFFYSDGDTVLVVQTPDGEFLCNDDTSQLLLDPTVEITKPAKGRYNFWAGSATAKDLVPGFLVLTTHGDVNVASLALRDLVKRSTAPEVLPLRPRLVEAAKRLEQATAAVKSAEVLMAGGDPVTKEITADGDLPAAELQTGETLCGGLVNIVPDYAFDWSGSTETLSLLVEAESDTTLLVRAPDGRFQCADDAGGLDNVNPLLRIAEPAEGRYLVWVGRVNPDTPASGTLTITEAAGAMPAAPQQ